MRMIRVAVFSVLLVFFPVVRGLAEQAEDAEAKAEEIHRVAISDMIYTQEEIKALYYQNVRIIELLKEIRDLLRRQVYQAPRDLDNAG